MKTVVIAAAGRLGQEVVREAARRGHDVMALARHPENVTSWPAHCVTIRGDARDPAAVGEALDGAEAVISTVPGGGRTEPHQARDTAQVLTAAMTARRVPRLVVTSAYPIVGRRPALAMALLRRIFAVPYADTAAADRIVTSTSLDWTIAYLNRLVHGPASGAVQTDTEQLTRPTSLTRADAATLLVDIAEGDCWLRRTVNVCGAGRRR